MYTTIGGGRSVVPSCRPPGGRHSATCRPAADLVPAPFSFKPPRRHMMSRAARRAWSREGMPGIPGVEGMVVGPSPGITGILRIELQPRRELLDDLRGGWPYCCTSCMSSTIRGKLSGSVSYTATIRWKYWYWSA